jgi:CheY-like chemotaxis protein
METTGGLQALIIDEDARARKALRQVLQQAGYRVSEAADPQAGLALLAGSAGGMVVCFTVVLFDNVMTGTDAVTVLGALIQDEGLARRHAYVAITPSPVNVDAVLGKLLARLAVPVVAEPLDATYLLATIARITQRPPALAERA